MSVLHPTPPRRSRAALLVAVVVTAVLLAGPGSADARADQDPTVTTVAPSQTVAGEPSPSVTTLDPGAPGAAPDGDAVDAENRRFLLIVGGLLAVALALLALTVRYWFVTRPGVPDTDDDLDPADDDAGDRFRDAFDDDDDIWRGGPADTGEVTVSTGRPSARSRRSVAGADHGGADEHWEPRATGEQERVSGQVPRPPARPSRDLRAQAFEVRPKG